MSEGGRELEAARQRLSIAKAQTISANQMVSSAQSMVYIANINLDTANAHLLKSQNEEKEATRKLDEVSQRLEVIDVDDVNNDVGNKGYVEEIIVEGAGTKEVNGRYLRRNTGGNVSSPYPSFSRKGEWQGKEVKFKMYRDSTAWIICAKVENGRYEDFYVNHNSSNFLPTKDDWCTCNRGIPPEPELKY